MVSDEADDQDVCLKAKKCLVSEVFAKISSSRSLSIS